MLLHKALSPGFEEDIFINYSHVDNATIEGKELKGFVDRQDDPAHKTSSSKLRKIARNCVKDL
jgi:hypothetical protein